MTGCIKEDDLLLFCIFILKRLIDNALDCMSSLRSYDKSLNPGEISRSFKYVILMLSLWLDGSIQSQLRDDRCLAV